MQGSWICRQDEYRSSAWICDAIPAAEKPPIDAADATARAIVALSPQANTPGTEVSLNGGVILISPDGFVSIDSCWTNGPLILMPGWLA